MQPTLWKGEKVRPLFENRNIYNLSKQRLSQGDWRHIRASPTAQQVESVKVTTESKWSRMQNRRETCLHTQEHHKNPSDIPDARGFLTVPLSNWGWSTHQHHYLAWRYWLTKYGTNNRNRCSFGQISISLIKTKHPVLGAQVHATFLPYLST